MLTASLTYFAALALLASYASVIGSLTHRKYGGIHFLKLGRLNLSISLARR